LHQKLKQGLLEKALLVNGVAELALMGWWLLEKWVGRELQ
jgi:hypothetical protein